MEEPREKTRVGLASLLKTAEIKGYFNRLFLLILGVELLIFIAHFAGAVGPGGGVFPWKQYFFISFIAPVALLFLTGLVVTGFNYFLFGQAPPKEVPHPPDGGERGLGQRTRHLLLFFNQLPVLGSLLAIGIGSVILYRLDVILKVVGHVGERTLFYLALILALVLGGSLIFLLAYLFWKFRLNRLETQRQWEFRNRVMETSGLIILDNNTVLDREGRVVVQGDALPEGSRGNDGAKRLALIPEVLDLKQLGGGEAGGRKAQTDPGQG